MLKAAEGRVWTGAQAQELGLVDELGGFARALEVAREAVGLEPGRPVELRAFPPAEAPWQQVLELLGGATRSGSARQRPGCSGCARRVRSARRPCCYARPAGRPA